LLSEIVTLIPPKSLEPIRRHEGANDISITLRHLKDIERLLRGNALDAIVADPSDPRSLCSPEDAIETDVLFLYLEF
jgi:hypothetical protein